MNDENLKAEVNTTSNENASTEVETEQTEKKAISNEPIEKVENVSKTQTQSRKENAKFAEMRRKRELEEAYRKGELAASEINTFTNEPIKDEVDLEIFKAQKEIAKKGGDPTNFKDLTSFIAESKRAELKKNEEFNKKQQKVQNEVEEFKRKYPDVDLIELTSDDSFKKFCGKRTEYESISEIYESYKFFKDENEKAINDMVKSKLAEEMAKKQIAQTSSSGYKNVNGENVKEKTAAEIRNKYNY